MTSLASILIGKKVRFLGGCECDLQREKIHEIENHNGYIKVKDKDRDVDCFHESSWELIEPLTFKPKPHEHTFTCECGAKK